LIPKLSNCHNKGEKAPNVDGSVWKNLPKKGFGTSIRGSGKKASDGGRRSWPRKGVAFTEKEKIRGGRAPMVKC